MNDKEYTAQLRETAKTLGCKALTGSAKQKKWAERLRRDFILQMSSEDAFLAVQASALTQTAWFWINTRELDRNKLEAALSDLIVATREANAIGSAGAGYEDLIAKRNAALAMLGFEDY